VRVTFIIPPSGFLLDERVFPTLGVLKVAAVLQLRGCEVDVLDLSGAKDLEAAVDARLRVSQADVYGITATMPQMPQAAAIAARVSSTYPEAKVILGGPHVTLMQASARIEQKRGAPSRASQAIDALRERFDVLVCGDGELAIEQALAENAPDLIDGDDPKSALFLKPSYLEAAPFPARHLIDVASYHYTIDGVRAQSLICQLGCPFECKFCGGRSSPFLRRARLRSSAQVVAEMRHLYDTYGTTGFMFFDDELNVNPKFMELLDQMVACQESLGVEFRLRGFLKAELLTAPMAKAMYRAGFRQALVGFESGHPRILQNILKKATRDDNTRAVEMLQGAGVAVKAAMSIGHPGESPETIDATRDWLLEVQPEEFDVTVITVYPGTPYFDEAREEQPGVWTYRDAKNGDTLHAYNVDQFSDANFYKGIPGSYRSFVYTDTLTPEDLCAMRDAVEAEVRTRLKIPYPTAAAAVNYEHSMGMN
jgi:anaerobic magnesium-protoporphyrin IX monomethyl ester cyclase